MVGMKPLASWVITELTKSFALIGIGPDH